jgi:hypothetical protein
MMSDRRTFGERLKRHRERRGITLQAISESSKIPVSLFAGLEAGDCSRWPLGIYGRAYLRAYAVAIGINAEEAVDEFAALFGVAVMRDGIEVAAAAPRRPAGSLRLSMVPEPVVTPTLLGKRAALAASDLVIACLIAAVAQIGFNATAWPTVAAVLAYFTAGRLISDDPMLFWAYQRMRRASPEPESIAAEPRDVPVGDAASTTA